MVQHHLDYVKLSNLKQDMFAAFFFSFEEALKQSSIDWSEDDFILSYVEEIFAMTKTFRQRMHLPKTASSLTLPLAEANRERDESFRTFRDMVKTYRYSRLPEQQEAYQVLVKPLSKVPNLTRIGYLTKTIRLNALFGQLGGDDETQALSTLGLEQVLKQVKNDQVAFEVLHAQQAREKYQQTTGEQEKLRAQLSEKYLDLCTYVCLRADHRPQSLYQDLFDLLHYQRQSAVDHQRRRKAWKKRKENQKKKEEEDKKEE